MPPHTHARTLTQARTRTHTLTYSVTLITADLRGALSLDLQNEKGVPLRQLL